MVGFTLLYSHVTVGARETRDRRILLERWVMVDATVLVGQPDVKPITTQVNLRPQAAVASFRGVQIFATPSGILSQVIRQGARVGRPWTRISRLLLLKLPA